MTRRIKMVIYDTFEIKGNCKGCGGATKWHINGDYPLCRDCMRNLMHDYETVMKRVEKEEQRVL
jgi:predicted amidophosphoribosyltransferase